MKLLNLTIISTPSHGYLKVSKKNAIKILGDDLKKISSSSGISKRFLYLEEDCDANIFFNKLNQKRIDHKIISKEQTHIYKSHNFDINKI